MALPPKAEPTLSEVTVTLLKDGIKAGVFKYLAIIIIIYFIIIIRTMSL